MQFTTMLTALSFGIGAQAWAQAANGEWIANNELGWDYNSGCKLSLPAGLIVWRCLYTQTCSIVACEGALCTHLNIQGVTD